MISPRLWPALALSLATASCAEGSADFHAKYAPEFTAGPTTISVFGAFHEGRMSHESWEKIGPRLSPILGEKACEVGYGDRLSSAAVRSDAASMLPHIASKEQTQADGQQKETSSDPEPIVRHAQTRRLEVLGRRPAAPQRRSAHSRPGGRGWHAKHDG